eukprot:12028986-Alexandrium_andersonii.AAC.1
MSASLVGSEMCIRDRGRSQGGPRVRIPLREALCYVSVDRGHYGLPPGPVSYTHLTLPTICSV